MTCSLSGKGIEKLMGRFGGLGKNIGKQAASAGKRAANSPQVRGAGRKAADAGKKAAKNKKVQGAAATAGGAAVGAVTKAASDAGTQGTRNWWSRRRDKKRAIALARQIKGGGFSENTIVDGEPHCIVWKNGVPLRAFPE